MPGKVEKVSAEDSSTVFVASGPDVYRVRLQGR
jgi:hypothetical protein